MALPWLREIWLKPFCRCKANFFRESDGLLLQAEEWVAGGHDALTHLALPVPERMCVDRGNIQSVLRYPSPGSSISASR